MSRPFVSRSKGRTETGYKDVSEENENVLCEVQGTIPSYLQGGSFYRQCGGAFLTAKREGASGLIDGLAHIALFSFEKRRKVRFSNKFMKTPDFEKFDKTGERAWVGAEFGPGPFLNSRGLVGVFGGALYDRVRNGLKSTVPHSYQGVNPNVVIWRLNQGRTLAASTEGPKGEVCSFDRHSLETRSRVVTMPAENVFQTAAHYYESSRSSSSSLHVALCMRPSVSFFDATFRFDLAVFAGDDSPFRRVHTRKWASVKWSERKCLSERERIPYLHTTVETKNYFIVPLPSLRIDYERLLSRDFREGFFGLFQPTSIPLGFYVLRIDRRRGDDDIALTPIGDFFLRGQSCCRMFWHVANAYEDELGRVVIDATSPPNMNTSTTESYRTNENFPCPLKRFVIDVEDGSVNMNELISEGPDLEFPNINPHSLRRRHRYVFALAKPYVEGSFVMKFDVERTQMTRWNLAGPSEDVRASEPIFVPSPHATSEDDGVVLTVSLDMRTSTSYLIVLDGKTMNDRARAVANFVVNFGLSTYFFY
eukprot:g4053.t1